MIEEQIIVALLLLPDQVAGGDLIDDPLRFMSCLDHQSEQIVAVLRILTAHAQIVPGPAVHLPGRFRIDIDLPMGGAHIDIIKCLCRDCMNVISHKCARIECIIQCSQQEYRQNTEYRQPDQFKTVHR